MSLFSSSAFPNVANQNSNQNSIFSGNNLFGSNNNNNISNLINPTIGSNNSLFTSTKPLNTGMNLINNSNSIFQGNNNTGSNNNLFSNQSSNIFNKT